MQVNADTDSGEFGCACHLWADKGYDQVWHVSSASQGVELHE